MNSRPKKSASHTWQRQRAGRVDNLVPSALQHQVCPCGCLRLGSSAASTCRARTERAAGCPTCTERPAAGPQVSCQRALPVTQMRDRLSL